MRLARPERFELPTFWFVARHSIQLSYGRVVVRRLWPRSRAFYTARRSRMQETSCGTLRGPPQDSASGWRHCGARKITVESANDAHRMKKNPRAAEQSLDRGDFETRCCVFNGLILRVRRQGTPRPVVNAAEWRRRRCRSSDPERARATSNTRGTGSARKRARGVVARYARAQG
jgi:hypothetical protein